MTITCISFLKAIQFQLRMELFEETHNDDGNSDDGRIGSRRECKS